MTKLVPQKRPLQILALSDIDVPILNSIHIQQRFPNIDLAISCGDLSYFYLEYILTKLDIPLVYVQGNHAPVEEFSAGASRKSPWGAIELHKRCIYQSDMNLIMAGIEGSLRYNKGKHQYTQGEMWRMVLGLVPKLLINKWKHGRYLDLFITHASPKGIHDESDRAHQGISAFRWLDQVFQPRYHLHGHIHILSPLQNRETKFGETTILNVYGYQEITFND